MQANNYLTSADGDLVPLSWQEAHEQEINDIKAKARSDERKKVIEEWFKKHNKTIDRAEKWLFQYKHCSPSSGTFKWLEVINAFDQLLEAIDQMKDDHELSEVGN